jgi:apolipoprotein N-acyltransferase
MSRAAVDYNSMVYAWMMLSTYCSLYVPLAVWLLRRLERRTALPLVLTVPCVWAALEFVRSFFLTGFAWYFLGHTQHDFLAIIQISDLAGVYAVTALVAAVNAWVFEFLYARPWFGRLWRLDRTTRPATSPRGLAIQGACVAAVFAAALGYGMWRLGQNEFMPGPRVALLQSNLDQRLRNNAANPERKEEARKAVQNVRDHFAQLREVARREHPDLMIWPEASYPDDWLQKLADVPDKAVRPQDLAGLKRAQDDIRREALRSVTGVLLGIHVVELGLKPEDTRRYSSAMLFAADGTPTARYDKMHRVPFGEYVPLKEWVPAAIMKHFLPYDYDYSVRIGEHFTRFPLGKYRFGVLICFEDTDPFLARRYAAADADGPPVDFLVNISNDGWFDGSSEHDEHLAICRFRAVETRRAVARAVNMGISAVIDSNGRVLRPEPYYRGDRPELPSSEWREYKQRAMVITHSVPIDDRPSLYALWGDWLPCGCWVLVGIGFFWRPPRVKK